MAANTIAATLASGVAFGAALTASGAYDPRVIVGQLQLRDFRMLELFLTGSTVSGLAIYLVQTIRKTSLRPKSSIQLGGLPYGGNLLGGAFIGAGMALSGACPGTVLVQATQGLYTGYYALLGSFLGGAIYAISKNISFLGLGKPSLPSPSISTSMNIAPTSALIIYELACLCVISLSMNFAPHSLRIGAVWPISSIAGGLVIGAAQLLSLILRGSSVGVSSVFGDTADSFFHLVQSRSRSSSSSSNQASSKQESSNASGSTTVSLHVYMTPSTYFALGLISGSALLTLFKPAFSVPTSASLGISSMRALLGGVLMSFGARLAAGCTSGHGLSGTAQLATASFITTAAMFGAGIIVATRL